MSEMSERDKDRGEIGREVYAQMKLYDPDGNRVLLTDPEEPDWVIWGVGTKRDDDVEPKTEG